LGTQSAPGDTIFVQELAVVPLYVQHVCDVVSFSMIRINLPGRAQHL
jgi:hypothetical protein